MAAGGRIAWFGVAALWAALGCTSTTKLESGSDDGDSGGGEPSDGESGGGEPGGGEPGVNGGSAGGAGGSAAGAGAVVPDSCADYCSRVQDACVGADAVYTGDATCLGVCGALPPGSPGDEIGNSVECRLQQARYALETAEPAVHCPGAGPGGDGICGQNCESYCVLLQRLCPARFDATFDGLAACATACGEIPDAGGFTTAISQGDSIQCRLWHVSAAAVDPSMHCGHAAGDAPCVAIAP